MGTHYEDLVSLLKKVEKESRGNGDKNKYLEAVEGFLSHMHENPKTMFQKMKEANTTRMREELRGRVVREAILYLDTLAQEEQVSMSEYSFRSAVIGDFCRLLADYVFRGA